MVLLDQQSPQWRAKIDPATLDMSYGCYCILGQVYGSFLVGSHAIGIVRTGDEDDYEEGEETALIEHGFFVADYYEYPALTAAWKEALKS